jgi:WS/DGAT/MGAT family acyltransferase
MTAYEPLSAQDSSFVLWERRETPLHVGAIAILDAEPLRTADGGIDADRIAKHVESRLHVLPRYRQRLAWTPIEGRPVWIDDDRFDLWHHLRRAALPRPGGDAELKQLVARILSERLDRDRPLWELWIVEGLDADRCALIVKVHHCMVDGVAGMNLLTLLMSQRPDEVPQPAPAWRAEARPDWRALARGESQRWMASARGALAAATAALGSPRRTAGEIATAARALSDAIDAGLRSSPATNLNAPIGPHRRVDWLALELDAVKAVKNRLGGTVNDVALATVAGALHRFLGDRGELRARLDYRIVIPVNMRRPGDPSERGNCVSARFLTLPVSDASPLRRYRRVRSASERGKDARAAEGIELLTRLADHAVAAMPLLRFGGSLISWLRPYNLIVTNVPGPRMPLWMLGARVHELLPLLPLFPSQGLGVAALSYCGALGIGLVADRDLAPDLVRLRECFEAAFEELHDAAHAA